MTVLNEDLQHAKKGTKVHYLSKDMQNEFLHLLAWAVTYVIKKQTTKEEEGEV